MSDCYKCKLKAETTTICKECQIDIEKSYEIFEMIGALIDEQRIQLLELTKKLESCQKQIFSDQDIVE